MAYGKADRSRRWPEQDPPAYAVERSDFERDRARVLHSSALRRLAAKTQVVGVGVDDFPRNRLTHSLECAQIGRALAEGVGADPDLVEAACLAHDLGHPPFGHTGEEVLDRWAEDVGGFEGNAQTLRILTRLEAKVLDPSGASGGLNLTRATLDATVKYPWPREDAPLRGGVRKFGMYGDDQDAYDWVRQGAPAGRRSVEAQVMDWADDVAYSVHDVEDGIHAGLVDLDRIRADADERAALCAVAAERYSPEPTDVLGAALEELLVVPGVAELSAYDGSVRSQAALKRMTSLLISWLIGVAVRGTREAAAGPLVRYAGDLAVPREARARCALLKSVATRYVMQREESVTLRAWQQQVVADLVAGLWEHAPDGLQPQHAEAWLRAGDERSRRRVVVDAVASMTDTSALQAHAALRVGAVSPVRGT